MVDWSISFYVKRYSCRMLRLRKFPASRLTPMPAVVQKLKMFNLYRYRGYRGGSWRRELGVDVGKVSSGESRDEKSIPVIFSIRGNASSSIRARDMKNLVPIPKRKQNPVSRTVSEFAVPKFLFTNICSLAKTKNRVRAAETHIKPEMPDAIANIPGYSIFRRDRNWSGPDKRSRGGIAIYARSNLNIIDVYRSKLYELLYVIFKLPSGHLLLTCGIYHPPKPTYQPANFLQYLTHLMDNALDQHSGLTIVAGGDVNQLDTNELIVMTGWTLL